jgi:hypothetical protein
MAEWGAAVGVGNRREAGQPEAVKQAANAAIGAEKNVAHRHLP